MSAPIIRAMTRALFIALVVASAQAGKKEPTAEDVEVTQAAPPPGGCALRMVLAEGFSKLDVSGELNGHPIELSKKATARPGGDVLVHLSRSCPKSMEDLLAGFSFTMESVGSLLIHPQEDLEIMAAKIVSVHVDKLQISLGTPRQLQVALGENGPQFRSEDGLSMMVTSGTATAMKHSFELTGFSTTVPFNGYFNFNEETRETTMHVTDFDANFPVHDEVLKIDGNFEVKGWMTGLTAPAGKLVGERQQALTIGGRNTAAESRSGLLIVAAVAAVVAVAAVLAAAVRHSRRAADTLPLRAGQTASSSEA